METSINTPEIAPVDPSALMDDLLAVAHSKQVSAERLTGQSVRIDFIEASVTVDLDTDNGLLLFDCPSKDPKSPEVLSTCLPIQAASGDKGPTNVYEFAEMLALLQGFTATEWPQEH
jgi:hypothetical protein